VECRSADRLSPAGGRARAAFAIKLRHVMGSLTAALRCAPYAGGRQHCPPDRETPLGSAVEEASSMSTGVCALARR
jgi:hypothetical protein